MERDASRLALWRISLTSILKTVFDNVSQAMAQRRLLKTIQGMSDAQALTYARVCPKSSSSQTKLSEHEANRGEAEKSECVSGEIFKILGQAATAIEPSEGAFDDPPPW